MATRDSYFLGHSLVEQQRLQQQAREHARSVTPDAIAARRAAVQARGRQQVG